MYKNIMVFLIILSLWFFSSIFFPFNEGFYHDVNKISLMMSYPLTNVIWIIIYVLISYSIFRINKYHEINNDYMFILIINYLFNQVFGLFFNYYNNLFISLICVIISFISSIFLYLETKKIDKKGRFLSIPYLLWNLYNLIIYCIIYFIN